MLINISRSKKLIAFFTLLFVVISLNWDSLSFGSEQQAVVTGSYVNIRSGPGTNYAKIDLVYKNDKLTVQDKSNDWYKVKLSSGKIGWIAGWLVSIDKITVPSQTKVDWKTYERLGTVTGSTVNIRSGPSTGYSILAQVTKGTQLGINQAKGDWYSVTLENGSKGWIAGWLIKVSTNPNYSSTTEAPTSSDNQTATVTETAVNVRTGAGTKYSKIGLVYKNDKLIVLDKSNDWYKVKLSNGKIGWIAGWLIEISTATDNPTPSVPSRGGTGNNNNPSSKQNAIVTGTIVNVRTGAGTNYTKITQVKQGETYSVLDSKDGWYKLQLSANKVGWIAGWLVQVNQVTSTDPEPSQTTTRIGVVTGTTVNIRKGPSTSYNKLGQVNKGDQLTILEEKDGWYKITTAKIKEGWIAGWLVEVEVDEKVIQVSLSEKAGASVLTLAGNEKLDYDVNENTNSLELAFEAKYKIEGTEKLKLVEPFKEIKVSGTEVSKIYIGLTTQKSYQVVLSQDKKVISVIFPQTTLKGKKIVLDPGHGGIDSGAVGPTGYKEKAANLSIALKLKDYLEMAGAEVVLTRTSDFYVSLLARSNQANTAQANIFVSIHANASTSSSVKGTKTFFYAPSSNAKLYAQLAQRKKLAELVQPEMVKSLERKDLGTGQENFSVLRETNIPSILVEVAFISNSEEETLLQLDEFQDRAAWSLANGIVQYFK